MIERIGNFSKPILNISLVRRIRRNHGFEHATIHMLSKRIRNLSVAGRADDSGFYLYGDVETGLVWEAAQEALHRMRSGEHKLAVHPNCGTGLVTTSLMTSVAAVLGLAGTKNTWNEVVNRLPLVMLLSIGALIISQPVGLGLQQHFTTLGDPGDLELVDVSRRTTTMPFGGELTVHRVHTRNG